MCTNYQYFSILRIITQYLHSNTASILQSKLHYYQLAIQYSLNTAKYFFNTTEYYQTQYCINTTFGYWLLPQYYRDSDSSRILQMHIPLLRTSNLILLNTSQYYIDVYYINTTPTWILHLLYHYYVNNTSILHQYYLNTTSILH